MIAIRVMLAAAAAVALGTSPVFAAWVGPGKEAAPTTAAAAAQALDDTPVRLEGHLVRKLDKDHYEFRDDSGTIQVEIDAKDLPAQDIGPTSRLRLTGEVDRGLFSTDVDIDHVEILR